MNKEIEEKFKEINRQIATAKKANERKTVSYAHTWNVMVNAAREG